MNRTFLRCSTALLLCVAPALGQSNTGETDRIVAEALKPSPLEANLHRLTDEIGGRVPGTPAMTNAVNWAVAAFKAAGADEVHTEAFTIPTSWAEGDTRINVVSPVAFSVRGVSIAWTPPLTSRRLRVIDVGEGSAEDFSRAGSIKGALVLVHSSVLKTWDDLFAEYLKAPPVIDAAVRGGAAAIAFTATREHDILYRHINAQNGRPDRLPMVLMAREDAERIARIIADGKQVQVELTIHNRIGPAIQTANVVAELRGSERPQEFVILGAHLDSWELGTGALDNGCNAALVIDTLRALHDAGIKPKRSIRFILFSGEEQGMLGSLAYVRQHRNELDNAVEVLIFDEGTGPAISFSLGGRTDTKAALRPILAPLAQWNASATTNDAFWGTDNFDFLLEGVPTLVANQQEANYLVNYHATSDTFDKVDLPQLKKHVAMAAAIVSGVANAPERVGPRQTRTQVEQLLHDTKLDEQLKTFGQWDDWTQGRRGRQAER